MKPNRGIEFAPANVPAITPGSLVGAGADTGGAGSACLAPSDFPPAVPYVPVRAAEDMLRVRTDQIFRHGHTPDADRTRPLREFARDLENLARAIREDEQFGKSADQIRRRAVKLGALAMAIVDKLDAQTPEGKPLG